jgi:hypothetical protein
MHNMVTRLLVAVALFWSGTLGVFAQAVLTTNPAGPRIFGQLPNGSTAPASVCINPTSGLLQPCGGLDAATTTMAAGTIAVTNTFQQALAASSTRKGCTLQNNDTNAMRVFFGAIGSATLTNSFVLAAGQAMSCNVGSVILTDAVNITGTATGAYVISNQ